MIKVIVASKNPVKIKATLSGFEKMFPNETFEIRGVSVPSGVSDQPLTDAETYTGAKNRTDNASQASVEADYWVGIEGGIQEKEGEMESFAWIVVKSKEGKYGKGRTGTLFLPPQVMKLIKEGKELGEADDIVFARTNSKQENGAVGILTHNVVDRTDFYIQAVIFALIPFKNQELYSE